MAALFHPPEGWSLPVEECAPTLAGLKCGTVFNLPLEGASLAQCLLWWDLRLVPRGVRLTVLRRRTGSALLYLYRPALLRAVLQREDHRAFLRGLGYTAFTGRAALSLLRRRLGREEGFPHEMGLFLGYPLPDVEGFIRHGGRCCKLTGYWKVYGDREEAERTFARYRQCSALYGELARRGCPVSRLAVTSSFGKAVSRWLRAPSFTGPAPEAPRPWPAA